MKSVTSILQTLVIVLNSLAAIILLVCAYSQTIHPEDFPSCSYLGMLLPAAALTVMAFIPLWLVFKKRYSLISIGTLLACYPPLRDYCPVNLFQSEPTGETLKVLSYNTHGFGCDNIGQIQFLLNADADIVCLQETYNMSDDNIRNTFADTYPYIATSNKNQCTLVVMSKLPIVGVHEVPFSHSFNGSCIFDLLTDKGDTIVVINNHLESYKLSADDKDAYAEMVRGVTGDEEFSDTLSNGVDWTDMFFSLTDKLEKANIIRSHQADSLATIIDNLTAPYVLVCGDFNDSPTSYVHHTLTRRLDDAFTESGNGPGISFNSNLMYFRIDNILISKNITPYNAKVDDSVKESDHYPIFCTLELH